MKNYLKIILTFCVIFISLVGNSKPLIFIFRGDLWHELSSQTSVDHIYGSVRCFGDPGPCSMMRSLAGGGYSLDLSIAYYLAENDELKASYLSIIQQKVENGILSGKIRNENNPGGKGNGENKSEMDDLAVAQVYLNAIEQENWDFLENSQGKTHMAMWNIRELPSGEIYGYIIIN